MKPLLLFFLLLCTANYALAETADTRDQSEQLKQYDTEIIIFEDAHARYINSESWNNDSSADSRLSGRKTKGSKTKDNKTNTYTKKSKSKPTNADTYTAIETEFLHKEYKRIKNSSEYNVLFYGAWRQEGLDKQQAFEIDLSELENTHRRKSKNTVSGNLKVVLARYLHFYSQLEYQQLNNQDDLVDKTNNNSESDIVVELVTQHGKITEDQNISLTQNNIYKMHSHRRMRSKELHYIDHPLVGILIQINPVPIEEPSTLKQTTSEI